MSRPQKERICAEKANNLLTVVDKYMSDRIHWSDLIK